MISFYPGPSRVYDDIPRYVKHAHKKGILSMNHRSDEFVKISQRTIRLLKEKLNVPHDYTVFYVSSATECWEIITQSAAAKRTYHIFNGAFGQKWYDYAKRIRSGAKQFPFDREELPNPNKYNFGSDGSVICITQNETSNGTQVTPEFIRTVKQNNPGHLIAVDATSSMAGIDLSYTDADIWFASVQKCFGLPAGLALMICSPKAIQQSNDIGERNFYNSMTFMTEMMEKFQTPFTPNVLNIYLLMRVLEDMKPIKTVEEKLLKRYRSWVSFFDDHTQLKHLVRNQSCHSFTVIPVTGPPDLLRAVKADAKNAGFLLGEGYGDLKGSTFRIANFPALKKKEIQKLRNFLQRYC